MIQRTQGEIEKVCRELWSDNFNRVEPPSITVNMKNDGTVSISLASMYDSPSLSAHHLFGLAEFFGTKNINDDDRFHESGCETCDYGSSYGFTLTVRPEKP